MRKRIFLFLCFAISVQFVSAQNTVESIRQRYAAIQDYIATHTGSNEYDGSDWSEYYHVESRQFLPGTGGHKEDIYMYWNEREEEKVYPSHYITFATVKYNFAARKYQEDFLYDEDGKLAFVFGYDCDAYNGETSLGGEHEFRFYLNKGKLIRAIVKKRTDMTQPFKEVYSGTTLPQAYRYFFENYQEKAEKIRQMFIAIEKEAYDYSE